MSLLFPLQIGSFPNVLPFEWVNGIPLICPNQQTSLHVLSLNAYLLALSAWLYALGPTLVRQVSEAFRDEARDPTR